MKRITLFLCALLMCAISFAQQCPTSIVRNNGQCAPGFDGAEIFITFFSSVECANTPPVITVTENGGDFTANLNEGQVLTCTQVPGGWETVVRYCSMRNIPPANTLCVSSGSCNVFCDGAGGPVPVTLNKFAAARSGNKVNMSWSTSTEINSKEFVIQKKVGTNWVDYAVVASSNRPNGASYTYTDANNTAKGITEYRLKMVDFGGAFKLSDIRPIKGLSTASDFTVYPNPSNGTAYVALSESFDKSTVQLLDNAGRVVKTESLQANGSTSFKNLTPGYYLIRVTNNVTGEKVTQKLSVIK